MSYNSWLYTYANPVNYTDPSGHCAGCFVFYFPGAGNNGTNTGGDEIDFLNRIQARTQAKVFTVYPYGLGSQGSNNPLDAIKVASLPGVSLGRKSDEIISALLGNSVDVCHNYGPVNRTWNSITFLAYSGGGQPGYAVAKSLQKNHVKVNNLITFGVPLVFSNGDNSNIEQVWSFAGERDAVVQSIGQLTNSLNALINPFNNQTYCDLLGDNNSPYTHWAPGNYFDDDEKFMGAECHGPHGLNLSISRKKALLLNKTRLQANVDMVVDIIERRFEWRSQ